MRAIVIGLALALCMAPLTASAQQVPQQDAVQRGLVAQFQAALIRERRLADERELRSMDEAQARLIQAVAQSDGRAAGAEAALEQARRTYAELVEQIATRDATARAEVEAYRAETRQLAAEATPERLAALQRFADGDRVGAWPVLDALRIAEDHAAEAASNARRAVRWRQDAELREQMRSNGEATVSDVLTLVTEAARLDPDDFATQIWLAELGNLREDYDAIYGAIDAAERATRTDEDRVTILGWRASIAGVRHQYAEEYRLASSAVVAARRVLDANPDSAAVRRQLIAVLDFLADVNIRHGELVLAEANAQEALVVSRALLSTYPQEASYKIGVVSALLRVGFVETDLMNLSVARAQYEEALVMLDALSNGGLRNFDVLDSQRLALGDLSYVQSLLGEPEQSNRNIAESVRIAELIAQADYGNRRASRSMDNVRSQQHFQNALGDAQGRKERGSRRVSEMREALSEHPSDFEVQDAHSLACMVLAVAHSDLGERTEAYALIDESLRYARQVAASNTQDFVYQDSLFNMLSDASGLYARFGDAAGARAFAEEALGAARAGMRLEPDDIEKQGDVLDMMWKLRSQFQSQRVAWADVVSFLTQLERRRELSAFEQDSLALARANAARESARR